MRITPFILAAISASALMAQPPVRPQGQGAPAPVPRVQQRSYAPVGSENVTVDQQTQQQVLARTVRPQAGSTRKGDNPVLFMIGDSTMRTGTAGNGDNGQIGWGYYVADLFDLDRITVENQAMGGTSSRSFYNSLWPDVVKGVRPGDWMIIQIGHNDSGPYDTARSRNSIPGTGKEFLEVKDERTGETQMVYSYGEYIRRYVNETRERGGKPILLSLTPRNKWNDDGTVCRYNDDWYTPWLKTVAEELDVPFLDFNNYGSDKYDNVFDHSKIDYLFFSDNIHTSDFGAKDNLSTFENLLRASDIELKNYLLPARDLTSSARKEGSPVLFLVGDQSICGSDSSFGWSEPFCRYIKEGIGVDNRAAAGKGTRTYLDAGMWDDVYGALEEGDYVIIEFGYDELGDINVGEARGVLPGNADEKQVMLMQKSGRYQGIYSFGFYLRKFCMDVIEKGATPILVSYQPELKNGRLLSNAETYGAWGRQAAVQTGAVWIDLNSLAAKRMSSMSSKKLSTLYNGDGVCLTAAGAQLSADVLAKAISASGCGLERYIR